MALSLCCTAKTMHHVSPGPVRQRQHVALLPQLLLLLALACVSVPSGAVRFVLQDTNPMCFVEDVGDETRIISGEYTRSGGDQDVPATLVVTAPGGSQVSSSSLEAGTHAFTASVDASPRGQHLLCMQVTRQGWSTNRAGGGGLVIDFVSDQSSKAAAKAEVPAARQSVNGMEVFSFREFGGQQKDMLRPAEYIRGIEQALNILDTLVEETKDEIEHLIRRFERMRYTSESTYTRIWSFGILTVLVMMGVTWLQFRFLKSTLRHKKLV